MKTLKQILIELRRIRDILYSLEQLVQYEKLKYVKKILNEKQKDLGFLSPKEEIKNFKEWLHIVKLIEEDLGISYIRKEIE